MWVQSLGPEDSLEEEMATHSSILAWKIPWTEEPGGLQSKGWQRVGHHSAYRAHTHTKVIKHKDGNKHGACVLKRHCQEQWLLSFLVSGFFYILKNCLNFPGSPAAKTPYSQCRGLGLDPWLGN